MVLDGPITAARFQPMSCRCWSQTLSPATSSSSTTSPPTRAQAYASCYRGGGRHLLYLPPFCPDFNPIENAFAKLKALLRKAAERAVDELWAESPPCLPAFTPKRMRKLLRRRRIRYQREWIPL